MIGDDEPDDPASEAALLERARSGDGGAFVILVRRYDRALRSLAYRLLGDRHAMDDVLQEAYLKAFRSIDRFRADASFNTWLYRIVHNACIDQLRRQRPTSLLDFEPPTTEHLEQEVSLRTDVGRALAALPETHRAVVMLVDVDGFDYGEVAAIVGVPVGTVRSRLSRARASLRASLKDSL